MQDGKFLKDKSLWRKLLFWLSCYLLGFSAAAVWDHLTLKSELKQSRVLAVKTDSSLTAIPATPTTTPTLTPSSIPAPTATLTITTAPTPTSVPTALPTIIDSSSPTPVIPTLTSTATFTPTPTKTPMPTFTPTHTPTPTQTPTPTSTSTPTPTPTPLPYETAVNQIGQVLLNNDAAALYALFSSELQANYPLNDFEQALLESAAAFGSIVRFEPLANIVVTGDWAEQDIVITTAKSITQRYRVILHYEEGIWKLFGTQTL